MDSVKLTGHFAKEDRVHPPLHKVLLNSRHDNAQPFEDMAS